jgi:hypothetical protein
MSTSDQNNGEDFAARLTERLPVDETSIGQATALPDVTMLSRAAGAGFSGQRCAIHARCFLLWDSL